MEFIRGNTLEQLLDRQGPFGGREAVAARPGSLSRAGRRPRRRPAASRRQGAERDPRRGRAPRADGLRHRPRCSRTTKRCKAVAGRRHAALSRAGSARRRATRRRRATSTASASCCSISSPARIPTRSARWRSCGGCRSAASASVCTTCGRILSEGFVHVVERALESDPAERYASVGAMQRGLTHALGLESGLDVAGDAGGHRRQSRRGAAGVRAGRPAAPTAAPGAAACRAGRPGYRSCSRSLVAGAVAAGWRATGGRRRRAGPAEPPSPRSSSSRSTWCRRATRRSPRASAKSSWSACGCCPASRVVSFSADQPRRRRRRHRRPMPC